MATKKEFKDGAAAVVYVCDGSEHAVDVNDRIFVKINGGWFRSAVSKDYVVSKGEFVGLIPHPYPLRSV